MRTLQRAFWAVCLLASAMAQPTGVNTDLQAVSQGAQLFSSNFVKIVAKEKPGNLICSPLSADIALSMTAHGAVLQTEAQFREVLKLPATKTQSLSGYQNLIDSLNDVENVTLKLANKLFIAKSFEPKPAYIQDLQTYFHSTLEKVDFSQREQAADIINVWCREKTENRIDNIVTKGDVDASTVLVLANAVYFKGKWLNEFKPSATTDRPFHVDANTVKQVPTMYRKGDYKFADLPEHNAKCIELPYANEDISMVIILPNEVDGLTAMMDKLDEVTADCGKRLAETYKREVKLYLPKFKTESSMDLKNTLESKMGLSLPFSDAAQFNDITDARIKIDKVIQKAFIEVNEEGSEAAAVTGIFVRPLSSVWKPPEPITLRVDHPFLAIVKHNDVTLFVTKIHW